eukprot:GHVR01132445.1.p1 GENE.GHVR01132445.1~~GHVR01132445.1.p1  ORF type:complete len:202 (-),score=31.26 GHVR01132445.1:814-1419(-)
MTESTEVTCDLETLVTSSTDNGKLLLENFKTTEYDPVRIQEHSQRFVDLQDMLKALEFIVKNEKQADEFEKILKKLENIEKFVLYVKDSLMESPFTCLSLRKEKKRKLNDYAEGVSREDELEKSLPAVSREHLRKCELRLWATGVALQKRETYIQELIETVEKLQLRVKNTDEVSYYFINLCFSLYIGVIIDTITHTERSK